MWFKQQVRAIAAVAALGLVVGCVSLAGSASGASTVRGFDGVNVKVAGLAPVPAYQGADIGAIARFNRANNEAEVKGVTFNYIGSTPDGGNATTALTEVRRLVEQEQVFAIVPDFSSSNPAEYLDAEHVLHLGWPLDASYCSAKPTTKIYGFGYPGCYANPAPSFVTDTLGPYYDHVSKKLGKRKPTVVFFGNDAPAAQLNAKNYPTSLEGAGFDVVSSTATMPATTTDYGPYVQQLMTANAGAPPDVVVCGAGAQCFPLYSALRNAGFTGEFGQGAHVDAILRLMVGSAARAVYNTKPSPALTQMMADLEAAKPGTTVTQANAMAYFAADMFIQAVKAVGVKKLTPEAVQKVLSTMTWQIKGLAGPLSYPKSTVAPYPSCSAVVFDTNGSAWDVVEPYSCSTKKFKVPD